MRRTTSLSISLLSALLCACAAKTDPTSRAPVADANACVDATVLRPGDVAAVHPLWAASQLIKSPSYRLAGVIVELQPGHHSRDALQAALRCPTACAPGNDLLALPGLAASLDETATHAPVMILRSDDPGTAREAMHRAERLLPRR